METKVLDIKGWTANNFNTDTVLPDISGSKGHQAVKSGQFIVNNVRNMFVQKSCSKWGRETSSRPVFVFLKTLYKIKASSQHLSSNICR